MAYKYYGYTQKQALEIIKANIEKSIPLSQFGNPMSEYERALLLDTINDMIKARTRTPEQKERDNAHRREARAKKRAERDEEILTLITPYMDRPRTASELEELTNHAIKAGEIRSYFQRHAKDVELFSPRTEWAYQIRG